MKKNIPLVSLIISIIILLFGNNLLERIYLIKSNTEEKNNRLSDKTVETKPSNSVQIEYFDSVKRELVEKHLENPQSNKEDLEAEITKKNSHVTFDNIELFEDSEFDDYTKCGIIVNNHILVGITSYTENKYNKIEVLKIDTTGKVVQRVVPDLPGTCRIKNILYSVENKEYYIIGSSTHLKHEHYRSWIINLSDSLKIKWRQEYKGLESTEIQASTIMNEGHIIIAGLTKKGKPPTKLWLAKIDNNGNEVWKKNIAFGNSKFEVIKVLTPNEKEIVLCGNILGLDKQTPFIIKFNKLGNYIIKPIYYMYEHQKTKVKDLAIDMDGNYVMVGRTFKNNNRSIWICKIDSNGNQILSKIYDHSSKDDALSVLVTENNEYVISGCTESKKNGNNGFILKSTSNMKFSPLEEIEYKGDDIIYHSIYWRNNKCLFMGKSNGKDEDFKKDSDAWIFTRDI